MSNGARLTISFFFTVFCVVLGLIPEIAMYFLWGVIHPDTAFLRLITIWLFFTFGAGISFVFAWISLGLWASGMGQIL